MLNRDELEMLVTAANISGYMEERGVIAVGDDTELTSFLLQQIDVFEEDFGGEPWWDRPPWHDFIECKLREQYGPEQASPESWEAKLNSDRPYYEIAREIGWGFSREDLEALMALHKAGKYRQKIEDLLEDCNFHFECRNWNIGNYVLKDD